MRIAAWISEYFSLPGTQCWPPPWRRKTGSERYWAAGPTPGRWGGDRGWRQSSELWWLPSWLTTALMSAGREEGWGLTETRKCLHVLNNESGVLELRENHYWPTSAYRGKEYFRFKISFFLSRHTMIVVPSCHDILGRRPCQLFTFHQDFYIRTNKV